MKNIFVLLVIGSLFYSGQAQNNRQDAIALEKEMVRFAKSMGDVAVTTSSMYRLIALEGDNSTYKDSLTYIYYSARKYASCFLMSNEVLKRDPKNKAVLELKALSLESLGALDKSMEAFKELFAVSKNNFHGYSLAKLQLTMKMYEEAYATIKQVEAINDEGIYKVNFAINQNHTQEVELLAAISYLKALIEIDLDKKPEAKISLEKSLKIQSDFVLAREVLDGLNK